MTPQATTAIRYKGRSLDMVGHGDNDHIFACWKGSRRFYEPRLLDRVAELKLPGCYIDCGAHVGNHTVFFSEFCPCDELVAVEAYLPNFRLLQANVTNHVRKPTQIVNFCIHHKPDGWATPTSDPSNSGDVSFRKVPAWSHGAVPTASIDELAKGRNVTLIKLDIQGGELDALRGAKRTINRKHPVLLVEATTVPKFTKLEYWLHIKGYQRAITWPPLAGSPTFLWRHPAGPTGDK